ncbi:MAG: hypothetical protein WCD70_07135 [Alphaproteobacteria bacterium]
MTDTDIIRVSIKSAKEMGFLGNAFGTQFLRPLVKSRALVVAFYGPSTVGKSTFFKNAITPFSSFHKLVQKVSGQEPDKYGVELEESNRLFRWKDFRYYEDERADLNWTDNVPERGVLTPRPIISAGTRPEPGFDLLEHAPMSYLDEADVVAVFGRRGGWFKQPLYFSPIKMGGAFDPDFVEQSSRNIKAKEIVQEMKIMGNLITIPPDEKNPAFHTLRMPQGIMSKVWGSLTRKADQIPSRYVTLILTTENPEARKAFQNFRQELNKYCC